jgi:hypothetical protein
MNDGDEIDAMIEQHGGCLFYEKVFNIYLSKF